MSLLNKIKESFPGEKTFTFDELDPFGEEARWISTGIPACDHGLKTFGLPLGIVELRGESQSGKTTMSLHIMKECRRQYGDNAIITILSSEKRDNKIYAKKIGLDLGEVLIHRISTIEACFNRIRQTIKAAEEALSNDIKAELKADKVPMAEFEARYFQKKKESARLRYLFVWDSIGNTPSAQEVQKMDERSEKDTDGQAAMGTAARAIGVGFRTVNVLTDDHDITLLVINRAYDKMDNTGKESYGGKAIKLFPTMRIEMSRKSGIKQGEVEIGQLTQVHIIKSDYGGIREKFDLEMIYGYGFVLSAEDLKFGLQNGFLEKFGMNGCKYPAMNISWMTRKQLLEMYSGKNTKLELLRLKLLKAAHDQVIKDRAKFAGDIVNEEEDEDDEYVAPKKTNTVKAKTTAKKLSKYKTKK
jgi:recombination protein RecA